MCRLRRNHPLALALSLLRLLQRAAHLAAQRLKLCLHGARHALSRLLARLRRRARLGIDQRLQPSLRLLALALETRDELLHLLDVGLLVQAPLHLGRVRLQLERRLHLAAPSLAFECHRTLVRVLLGVDDAREALEGLRKLRRVDLVRQRLLKVLDRLALRLDDVVKALEREAHYLLDRRPLGALGEQAALRHPVAATGGGGDVEAWHFGGGGSSAELARPGRHSSERRWSSLLPTYPKTT